MSLEQELKANTDALKANTEMQEKVLAALKGAAGGKSAPAKSDVKTDVKTETKPTPKKPAARKKATPKPATIKKKIMVDVPEYLAELGKESKEAKSAGIAKVREVLSFVGAVDPSDGKGKIPLIPDDRAAEAAGYFETIIAGEDVEYPEQGEPEAEEDEDGY